MTYKETRNKLVNEELALLTEFNNQVEDYTEGETTVGASINGWVDVQTDNLTCTIYSSDSITEISISPKSCGSMTVSKIVSMADQLGLEEKWIKQAYLAIRYYEEQQCNYSVIQ